MTLQQLQDYYAQNNLGQFKVYQDPARLGGQNYVYVPGAGSSPGGYFKVDQATLDSLNQSQLVNAGSTLIDKGGGVTSAAFSNPLSGQITNGVISGGPDLISNYYNQAQSQSQQNQEEQRVAQLNAAIKSGNTAAVEKLQPGYTLWNGAFVQSSQVPTLQSNGSTVQNGNVVGPQLPQVVQTVLDGMKSQGLALNPNIPITSQTAQEFLSFAAQNANSFLGQAQKEIAPYYQTQLKLAADTLGKSLGYNENQLLQNEKDIQNKYSDTLKNIGTNAAEKGFALSGERQLNESNLARDTQQAINQGRSALAFQEGNQVGNFAREYGASNLPNIGNSPTPRVLSGQSQFESGPSSPYYQLSPNVYNGLIGSQQFAETSAEQQRASQLEGLQNQQNANARTLSV